MAYLVGLTITEWVSPRRIAGVVSLSGFLPVRNWVIDNIDKQFVRDIKILHCHGTADDIVPFKAGEESVAILNETDSDLDITFLTYKDLGHAATDEELVTVLDFMLECISQRDGTLNQAFTA
eukprot:GHVN01041313.1.p2 GENE.GHVN01041313.1~~GHVN01041313.1.p2  ORF type:complete len:122 (-),score=14.32 GHVN01041313.1:76-441(-)